MELQQRSGLDREIQSLVDEKVESIRLREAITAKMAALRKNIESCNVEQTRIRNLITALERGEALYARYLGKLDQLESQIEKAQAELSELEKQRWGQP
jgi:chromosome segregation ATPase